MPWRKAQAQARQLQLAAAGRLGWKLPIKAARVGVAHVDIRPGYIMPCQWYIYIYLIDEIAHN